MSGVVILAGPGHELGRRQRRRPAGPVEGYHTIVASRVDLAR
ncbi:hypothetical protein X736_31845 [Mesorhizobium sp. L2C089B000]|nr:hypothetical protein X736_31845 [Mesorhizobium sp. L2C089B000]